MLELYVSSVILGLCISGILLLVSIGISIGIASGLGATMVIIQLAFFNDPTVIVMMK